jgi:hypothetical protein
LEAAIGIEPMNKGFAELSDLFAYVSICSVGPILIAVFGIRVYFRSPGFGIVSTSSDPPVTQIAGPIDDDAERR